MNNKCYRKKKSLSNRQQFDRYIIHVLPCLPDERLPTTGHPDVDRLLLWNEGLDASLPSLRLSATWRELDTYLQVYPERFDQITHLMKQRRLWLGPWYMSPAYHLEDMIGSLLLARQSEQVFGIASKTALVRSTHVIPSLFLGFGYRFVCRLVSSDGNLLLMRGTDGLTIPVLDVAVVDECFDPLSWRERVAGSIQHLALAIVGRSGEIRRRFEMIRDALRHDDVYLTHPDSLRVVVEKVGNEAMMCKVEDSLAMPSLDQLALSYAWRLDDGDVLPVPWGAVRRFPRWRQAAEGTTNLIRLDDCVQCTPSDFHVCVVKPREDGQAGVIVRGVNIGDERQEIKLRLWRCFDQCAIVRLDEQATGGMVAVEDDGSVSFMATPRQQLTFWFRDT